MNSASFQNDPCTEIERTWHLNTTNNSVKVGSLGMVKKNIDATIKKIPGKPDYLRYKRLCS